MGNLVSTPQDKTKISLGFNRVFTHGCYKRISPIVDEPHCLEGSSSHLKSGNSLSFWPFPYASTLGLACGHTSPLARQEPLSPEAESL